MPTPAKVGCAIKPDPKPEVKETVAVAEAPAVKEESHMITVGKKAPEFSAKAFYKGEFVDVSLSEYAGKWTVLCFYPGDFTFV